MMDLRILLRLAGKGPIALIALALVAGARAEALQIIDRMVAVVDGEVVTGGDIANHRALATLFGDLVPEGDSAVLDQIIENMLIARQIEQFPAGEIRDADVEAYLGQFTDPGGLPRELVFEAARRRIERARYFESLRRSLRATDEEIRERYENEFVPALRARGENVIPPLSQVEAELAEIVIADKLNQQISARVETLYRRYEVDVVE